MRSDFLKIMQERGFLHQCTDVEGLDKKLAEGSVTSYTGYDPTGASLHVGHLLPIMMQRWLQKTGGRPLVLMGGATAMIGDPSGKSEGRQMLTREIIQSNTNSIAAIFGKYVDLSRTEVVNNNDWLKDLNYIDFLRDYGPHFTINRMLTFDSVKSRLEREQPLTFLEFNYMLLQAYDFMHLYKTRGCCLQMAGSDQWGNIVNGVELSRRVLQKEVFGLTCALLSTASGAKMGKTASGAVWLKEDMLSPYDFYQYWRNTEDADVVKFLKLFTELPMDEIARLEKLKGSEINEAKKILAFETTKMCHGEKAAQDAAETARKAFEEGASADGLPSITVARAKLAEGIPAFALFKDAGLAASGGEARRLIAGGGARINDEKVENDQRIVTLQDLNGDSIKLSAGKKKFALVIISN